MSQIRVYFEGNPGLKRPIQIFLEKADPRLKDKIKPIPGRGRDDTIHDFLRAKSQHPDVVHILLLDSEGPDDGGLFLRLQQQENWRVGPGLVITEGLVGWMVQLMESWFLADRAALRHYYGSDLHENSLPRNPKVEEVPKADVLDGLKRATRNTVKGSYHKGAHAMRLLELLNPQAARDASRNCDRLFKILIAQCVG